MEPYRNRFPARSHAHLGIQSFPVLIEFTHQTTVGIDNTESRYVNGTKFDYLALPAIIHDLQRGWRRQSRHSCYGRE